VESVGGCALRSKRRLNKQERKDIGKIIATQQEMAVADEAIRKAGCKCAFPVLGNRPQKKSDEGVLLTL
jgi:hypothetical protein